MLSRTSTQQHGLIVKAQRKKVPRRTWVTSSVTEQVHLPLGGLLAAAAADHGGGGGMETAAAAWMARSLSSPSLLSLSPGGIAGNPEEGGGSGNSDEPVARRIAASAS